MYFLDNVTNMEKINIVKHFSILGVIVTYTIKVKKDVDVLSFYKWLYYFSQMPTFVNFPSRERKLSLISDSGFYGLRDSQIIR